jgi:hypothetical protein
MYNKRLIISICIFLLLCIRLSAQETSTGTPNKKEIRDKKRMEKEKDIQNQFDALYKLLNNRSFVLEAEYASQDGAKWNVKSGLSFVKIDSTIATIQATPGWGFGDNGFGGFTAQGQISKYNLSKNDKRKSCDISVTLKAGVYGSFNLFFNVILEGLSSVKIMQERDSPFSFDGYISDVKNSKILNGLPRQ